MKEKGKTKQDRYTGPSGHSTVLTRERMEGRKEDWISEKHSSERVSARLRKSPREDDHHSVPRCRGSWLPYLVLHCAQSLARSRPARSGFGIDTEADLKV